MNARNIIELNRDTMSVPEMRKLLGLGKTESYWLLKHRDIETIMMDGKIRVIKASFEKWYANQSRYRKVDGPPPGEELLKHSLSVTDAADILGTSDETIYDLIHSGKLETEVFDNRIRILRESFDKWYETQDRLHNAEDRALDEKLKSITYSAADIGKLLGADRITGTRIITTYSKSGKLDLIYVADRPRVTKESFEYWLASQKRYRKAAFSDIMAQELAEKTSRDKGAYKVDEVSALTGLSSSRIRKMITDEAIDVIKYGSMYLIPKSEFDRICSEYTSKTPNKSVRLCSLSEATERHGIDRSTLYRMIKAAGIETYKKGKYSMIPEKAVDKLVSEWRKKHGNHKAKK